MSGAAVTPSGVREGDPAALAALCTVRGPSVLAYCRQVAGDSEAGSAAADAFARFRKAVVEAGDTTAVNPEALLISATRTSAAQQAHVVAPGHCAAVPRLLAERADKTLPDADLARLEAHLAECWACRAPVARFKAAERAYLDPPEPKLDPAVAEQILAALVAAVPPPPEPEPEPLVLQAPNGAVPHAAPDPDATQAFVSVGEPRPAAPEPAEYDPADVAADEISSEPAPRTKRARRATPALLGGLSRRGKRRERGPQPAPAPEPEPEALAAAAASATAFAVAPVSEAGAHEAPAPEAIAEPAPEPAAATTPDPIPYEAAEYAPRPRDRRATRSRRLPVLLPIVLIVLALLLALFVSGVFGGSEPESSPRVSVPAAAPTGAAQADLVVVPGAKDATGDEVELAKARDRARQRGETLPADKSDTPAKKQAAATTPPPPPAAAGTPAANAAPPPPPPPPPPPAVTKRASGEKQIDAGSGATGAEQIPPPADTSDVPDLAPPTDGATSP